MNYPKYASNEKVYARPVGQNPQRTLIMIKYIMSVSQKNKFTYIDGGQQCVAAV